ncbi:MAG: cation transporter [Dehalococcoidales bacterium]|nr:MAG: cation transporter [Dehalococcoidales bacterium]
MNLNRKSKAAGISILSNTSLILLKLVAGIVTGSVSLIAEAIHSMMDLLAAVVAFISVRVSDNPPDAKHPFGHGKAENISGVIEGVLIFIAAGLIINEAVHKIVEGTSLEMLEIGMIIMAVSIIVNIVVSRYLVKVSRDTDSLALEADATHLTTDVITMVGVLIGLVVVRVTGLYILDPIIAIIVAIIIIKAAFDITRKSFGDLMDTSLPEPEQKAITLCVQEHIGKVSGFHKLRTRKAGSQRYLDLHLVIPRMESLEQAHDICDHLENDINGILERAEVNIHVEPCDTDCEKCPTSCDVVNSISN